MSSNNSTFFNIYELYMNIDNLYNFINNLNSSYEEIIYPYNV